MASCNVLFSSSGRRVGLMQAFRRDLHELGVSGDLIAADASRLCPTRAEASRFVQLPLVSEPDFAQTVLSMCQELDVSLVVPTIDPELSVYAAMRSELEDHGVLALVSGPGTIDIGGDKRATWQWLTSQGLPTVDQWDSDEARELSQELPFPLITKPASGSASVGVRRLATARDLDPLDEDMIVQEIAPGHEYTVDVWVDREGIARCAVPRRRLEVRAGEVSKGVTERRRDVIDAAMQVASALPDAFGPLTIQLFAAREGEVKIIEINPRFGGGYPLAWEAGARFPRWAIQQALGAPLEPSAFDWQDGLVMLRYDEAVYLPSDEVGL